MDIGSEIDVRLIRSTDNGVQTTGKWYVSGEKHFACDTLERAYKNNERRVSCIPPGRHPCRKVGPTEKIPYPHFQVLDVPNRDGICGHAGNKYTDSLGCILFGMGFSDINKDGELDILNSRNTFDRLMAILPDEFMLTITEAQTVKKPIIT